MTDTTTLAPTDTEILDAAEDFRSQYTHGGTTFDALDEIGFARAVLARWGTPAPASGELVAEVMFDERKYIKYTIPLELLPVGAKFYTAPEVRVPLSDAEALAIVRSVPALFTAEDEWLYCIREVEHHHGITAAQEEAP